MKSSILLQASLWAILLILVPVTEAMADGISIDAGITPPQGRWILRTQVRSMSREAPDPMNDSSMDRLMIPLVVVHGVRPALTVGVRQIFDSRSMTMNGVKNTESGLSDLYIFAKYKVLRINTRNYTVGIAPVLGIEPPTGSDGISSESWDLNTGLYISGRAGKLGVDVNLGYQSRGFAGVDAASPEPGNELNLEMALSRQIPLGNSGRTTLAPVLELTWSDKSPNVFQDVDQPNSGESVFSLAPGMKYTIDDLIIEGMVRFPVAQDQAGMQLEVGPMALLGVRRMF